MTGIILNNYKATGFLLVANTLVFLLILLNGGPSNADTLLRFGASNPVLIAKGEYLRIITSAFVHTSILHYIFNIFVIYTMVPSIERKFGSGVVISVFILAVIFDGLFTPVVLKDWQVGAGASVGYFGLYGLAIGTLFFYQEPSLRSWARQFILPMILILIGVEIFFRLKSGSPSFFLEYSLGHLTGLVAGLIMAGIIYPRGYELDNKIRIIFIVIYISLTILFFYLGDYKIAFSKH